MTIGDIETIPVPEDFQKPGSRSKLSSIAADIQPGQSVACENKYEMKQIATRINHVGKRVRTGRDPENPDGFRVWCVGWLGEL